MATTSKRRVTEKPLTMVMEDYLEAIYDLDQEKRFVRVRDIAKRMNVKMPTVTSMLKTLSDRQLVHYEKYEYIELTRNGTKIGKEMRRRHGIINEFLTTVLKIDKKDADEEACKMEHALTPNTLDSLTDFMEFIQKCPRAGESWLERFEAYRLHGRIDEECQSKCEVFSDTLKKKTKITKQKQKTN
jgi:DtxR family Mn-dependent transcriptional regulator